MAKSVADKARVKHGATIAVLHPARAVVDSLGLPDDVRFVDKGAADLVFVFVKTRAELEQRMPVAVRRLASGAALWVFYPKGSKAAGFDVNRDVIWAAAERLKMSPLGLVSVDETWSAFRLRMAE